jgi:hypothetical protein
MFVDSYATILRNLSIILMFLMLRALHNPSWSRPRFFFKARNNLDSAIDVFAHLVYTDLDPTHRLASVIDDHVLDQRSLRSTILDEMKAKMIKRNIHIYTRRATHSNASVHKEWYLSFVVCVIWHTANLSVGSS